MSLLDVPIDRVDATHVRAALALCSQLEDRFDEAQRDALARVENAIAAAQDDRTDRRFRFRVRVHLSGSEVHDETSAWAAIETLGSSLPFVFPIEHLTRRQRWAIALSRTGFLAVEISVAEVAR